LQLPKILSPISDTEYVTVQTMTMNKKKKKKREKEDKKG
jgi:hypothetical protein